MQFQMDHRCEWTSMSWKNISGCWLNTSWATLIFFMYTCMISKDIGRIKGKEMCLQSKESVSVHRYEKKHMKCFE